MKRQLKDMNDQLSVPRVVVCESPVTAVWVVIDRICLPGPAPSLLLMPYPFP